MGIGKTLQVIVTLLIRSLEERGERKGERRGGGGGGGDDNEGREREGREEGGKGEGMEERGYPSLVVCPGSVIPHWEREVYKFVNPSAMRVHRYSRELIERGGKRGERREGKGERREEIGGRGKGEEGREEGVYLSLKDVVLVSYTTLAREKV